MKLLIASRRWCAGSELRPGLYPRFCASARDCTFVAVFAVALVCRLAFIAALLILRPGFWGSSVSRWAELGWISLNLYEGRGFSSPFSAGTSPTAWLCPLVPGLWAGVMWFLGNTPTAVRALALLQTIPSALSCAFYWLLARHMSRDDRPSVGCRRPLTVGLAACFWPESILRMTNLWYLVWQELGVVVLVWCAMMWLDSPSKRRAILLGVAAGLMAWVNVTPLPIFIVALAAPLLRVSPNRSAICGYASLALLVALLVMSPWLARNALRFGRLIPMRSNTGFQLFEANNTDGCVRETSGTKHPASDEKQRLLYDRLGEAQYNQMCLARALRYMALEPGKTMTRAIQRFYVVWFTDVLDCWPDIPGTRWWYSTGHPLVNLFIRVKRCSTILSALLLLALVACAAFSGRFRGVPYGFLFVAVLLAMSFPHYLMQVSDEYTEIVRHWLRLLVVFVWCGKPPSCAS